MKLELVFLACLFAFAFGALYEAPPSTHPDHPGMCWIEEIKSAVKPGEDYTKLGTCVEYRCHSDFSYHAASCGQSSADPPCYVTEEDHTKVYPDCCPKPVCP